MAGRKRTASSSLAADEPVSRRRPRRVSSRPKKSAYFEGDSGDSGEEEVKASGVVKRLGRGRPPLLVKGLGRDKSKSRNGENEHMDDDYDSDGGDDGSVKEEEEEEEAENEDEDDEDEDDEDAPPKVTIVPLAKLRPEDGVEYEDEKLHPNTLLFQRDLKKHNQRTWLKSHDAEYRRALKDWTSFVETLTTKIATADFTIPELPAKDVVFRIHRDIRFSKDPTPYKPHFSAAWSRTGRKGPYACYYVHVEPGGNCFVGGGLWHPPADQVRALRESIDERPRRWRRVLNEERFRRVFLEWRRKGKGDRGKGKKDKGRKRKGGGGEGEGRDEGGGDEEAALLAFAGANQDSALKTKPKGYVAEHRDIELLKLRSYTIGVPVDDNVFIGDDAQEKLMEIIEAMVPFVTFLNRIVMPDLDDEDSSDEDDAEDGNGGDEGGADEDDNEDDEED